jgi:hypothetical protein
MRGCADCMNS